MNEDITRMAREAGFVGFDGSNKTLCRFAELVRADERDRAMRENAYVQAEREACAKLFEPAVSEAHRTYANAIRNRGNT